MRAAFCFEKKLLEGVLNIILLWLDKSSDMEV